jgi:D-aminopeptidase
MRCACLVLSVMMVTPMTGDPPRPRARDLGLVIGSFEPGAHNAITDVGGVRVGHATIRAGDAIRTGVTAVLPHGGNLFREKVPAAVAVGNGFGKLAGSTQVAEMGTIETPIVLTNTLSVGTAMTAVVRHTLGLEGNADVLSVNAVVAETNDGFLNDIRGMHVTEEHVVRAIREAAAGPVAEGCVGAGTGTRALGFKAGIGTASRKLPSDAGGYTIGVLVQANFGGSLVMAGVPVGRELSKEARGDSRRKEDGPGEGGSCIVVIATDAPLLDRSLGRLSRRAFLGLARVGSTMASGSGDYTIAFSTARENRIPPGSSARERRLVDLDGDALSPLFAAVVDATEEAVLNSILRATTETGREGRRVEALPVDRVIPILEARGAIPKRAR